MARLARRMLAVPLGTLVLTLVWTCRLYGYSKFQNYSVRSVALARGSLSPADRRVPSTGDPEGTGRVSARPRKQGGLALDYLVRFRIVSSSNLRN